MQDRWLMEDNCSLVLYLVTIDGREMAKLVRRCRSQKTELLSGITHSLTRVYDRHLSTISTFGFVGAY